MNGNEHVWLPPQSDQPHWSRMSIRADAQPISLGSASALALRIHAFQKARSGLLTSLLRKQRADAIDAPLGESGEKVSMVPAGPSRTALLVWARESGVQLDETAIQELFPERRGANQLCDAWVVDAELNRSVGSELQSEQAARPPPAPKVTIIRSYTPTPRAESAPAPEQACDADFSDTRLVPISVIPRPAPEKLISPRFLREFYRALKPFQESGYHDLSPFRAIAQYLPDDGHVSWGDCISQLEPQLKEWRGKGAWFIAYSFVDVLNKQWFVRRGMLMELECTPMQTTVDFPTYRLLETREFQRSSGTIAVHHVRKLSPAFPDPHSHHSGYGFVVFSEDHADTLAGNLETAGTCDHRQLSGYESENGRIALDYLAHMWALCDNDRKKAASLVRSSMLCEELRHAIDHDDIFGGPKGLDINQADAAMAKIVCANGIWLQSLSPSQLAPDGRVRASFIESLLESIAHLARAYALTKPQEAILGWKRALKQSFIHPKGRRPPKESLEPPAEDEHDIGAKMTLSFLGTKLGMMPRPLGLDDVPDFDALRRVLQALESMANNGTELRDFIKTATDGELVHPIDEPPFDR